MDIELLFSRQPFVQRQSDRFSIVRPNRSELTFDVPAELRNANLVIEVVAEGMRRSQFSYANQLRVQVI